MNPDLSLPPLRTQTVHRPIGFDSRPLPHGAVSLVQVSVYVTRVPLNSLCWDKKRERSWVYTVNPYKDLQLSEVLLCQTDRGNVCELHVSVKEGLTSINGTYSDWHVVSPRHRFRWSEGPLRTKGSSDCPFRISTFHVLVPFLPPQSGPVGPQNNCRVPLQNPSSDLTLVCDG